MILTTKTSIASTAVAPSLGISNPTETVKDSFDFNEREHEYLGDWNFIENELTINPLTLINESVKVPLFGNITIHNSDYRAFKNDHNEGGNYHICSTIRKINIISDNEYSNKGIDNSFSDTGFNSIYKFPSIQNYPTPNELEADSLKSREDSGRDYLSNEIYYRVSLLRENINPDLKVGHIHMGYLKSDLQPDRSEMVDIIKYAIIKSLKDLSV